MQIIIVVFLINLMPEGLVPAKPGDVSEYPQVTAPPESFFEKVRERDRQAAREFYKKYIDVKGMPVVAAAEVADLALQRTYEIVNHMLAGRSRAEDRLPNTAA